MQPYLDQVSAETKNQSYNKKNFHFHVLFVAACRYGASPFEYVLGESGGSLQLAVVNCQIKWPPGPSPPYPEPLHQFVTWMLQPQATIRPRIDDVIIHVDKLIYKFST
ncbi:hypothetical protein AAC387_Pa07g1855 [Persea americana]